ncbi:hypothetical protein L7F22_040638 [Adiantum nelumboides]|nr:hypothetical protein [Adiantum nelumboides]
MCGAFDCGDLTKEECILERSITDEGYIPEPYPEYLFESFGWTQIFSTLDICVNELTPTKFCDDEGNNLVTLQMASVILESGSESDEEEESTLEIEYKRIVDEISVIDIEKRTEDKFMDSLSEDLPLLDEDIPIIKADNERSSESKSERRSITKLEKFYDFSNQKPRRQERYRQKRTRKSRGKKDKPMPLVKDKTGYLRLVKANACIKDKITGQFVKAKKRDNHKKNKLEKKGTKLSEGWEIRSGMTKNERKSEYNKLKKTFKDVCTTEMEMDEDANSDKMDVPFHYKKYTIQDRKIIVQQPMRELKEPGTSYDGPEKAKKIDLVEPEEEPKHAYIATDLTEEEEQLLIATLKQYRDVFVWSYKDLKGVDPSICIPQQNGVVECKNRHIAEVAHALMSEKNMSPCYWIEAASTTVYTMNRTPTIAIHDMAPKEKFIVKEPNVSHFKVFGLRVIRDVVLDEMATWYADVKDDIGADVNKSVVQNSVIQPQVFSGLQGSSASSHVANPWSGRLSKETGTQVGLKSLDEELGIPSIKTPGVRRLHAENKALGNFAFMAKIAQDIESTCFEEDAENVKWQEAMNEEMDALYGNETWELMPLHKDANHPLYVHKIDANIVMITIYVDDLITGGDALKDVEHVKALLYKQLDMKDLGQLCYFWGLR